MDTRATLLQRIRNPQDQLAWSEFVRLYAPLLHAYAMKAGLQDADAADLAQETLRHVLRASPGFRYDPAIGTFRGWLFTIARNEIRKVQTRRRTVGTGDTQMHQMLENQPDEPSEADWDREYQLHLFHRSAERVKSEFRDNTWQAFWRTVVLNEPIETVAKDLAITAGAVYIARSRITARIRDEIQKIEG